MKLIKKIIVILFIPAIIFINGCEKNITTTQPEPEPSKGKIIINSAPENALIFVNGRNSGRYTPDSLTYYEDGSYTITLKKKYFKDTSIVVLISDEETKELFVDYTANPAMFGSLNITSTPPGAAILLNDSILTVNTPTTISNLLPGEYLVKVKLEQHREVLINAIVSSSNVSSYSAVLRDTSLWVDYQLSNSTIPSNFLTSIKIDQQGIKWIGSSDKGLIKFDGLSFATYNTLNSQIPSNIVNCVAISPQNEIWIGTNQGIGIYNGNSWRLYNRDNSGLTSNTINSINWDDNGIVWIGASSGLIEFDGVEWKTYNDDKLRLWTLSSLTDLDRVWIGTNKDGIMSLKNGIINYYPDSIFHYPSNKISSIAKDALGNIWFCHSPDSNLNSGVSYYNGNTFTSYSFGSTNTLNNHLTIDQFNNKWISTFNGIVRYNSVNSSTSYTTSNSLLSSNRCTSTAIDSEGVLWITTSGGGLNKFKFNSP